MLDFVDFSNFNVTTFIGTSSAVYLNIYTLYYILLIGFLA